MEPLNKYVPEVRKYHFDFSQIAEIEAGDTIATVVSVTASPSGLTLGSGTISGNTVQVQISAGTAGITYDVAALITTSSGATIEGIGRLFIES